MLRGREANAAAMRWTAVLEQLHLIGLRGRLPADSHCSCACNGSNCGLNVGRRTGGEEGWYRIAAVPTDWSALYVRPHFNHKGVLP